MPLATAPKFNPPLPPNLGKPIFIPFTALLSPVNGFPKLGKLTSGSDGKFGIDGKLILGKLIPPKAEAIPPPITF